MDKVNVLEKFGLVSGYWNPGIAASLNGQDVKLVKFKGAFTWHHHEKEDELFFVIRGGFRMEFRDKIVTIGENEFLVVPKGVEHRPVADEEVWVMLFEPSGTLNTGNTENAFTKNELCQL